MRERTVLLLMFKQDDKQLCPF